MDSRTICMILENHASQSVWSKGCEFREITIESRNLINRIVTGWYLEKGCVEERAKITSALLPCPKERTLFFSI